MKKYQKGLILILFGLIILTGTNQAQKETVNYPAGNTATSLIYRLHTLSIHVRDTITHDSVFQFLALKLKLPVYYYPVGFSGRKYAGVYAGNLVLEPCGPYSDYTYASDDFKAIFFGLTFEPLKPLPIVSSALSDRDIFHEDIGSDYIYIKDSVLCGENITISFMDNQNKIKDERRMDSLRFGMTAGDEDGLDIEYVKELCIGYRDKADFMKWEKLISPAKLSDNQVWKASKMLDFHFVKSEIREVQSITFEVRSLEKAREYLLKNNLFGHYTGKKIELDKGQCFGLSIFLTEDD